jgi:hypothetical protein
MGRWHLFEVHDQPWCPRSLRDGLTDSLQFAMNFGNNYAPIAPRLRRALGHAGTQQIIDLCSGGGGPWLRLCQFFEGGESQVCLTDKYPNRSAMEFVATASQHKIRFHSEPVDVMRVPEGLQGFRTLFTSFHHFRPAEARAILQDAVEKRQGIGIFEITRRDPIAILLGFTAPLVIFLVPFMRPFRWSRLLWTYLIPLLPLVALFDGIVSCLRTYSPAELRELVDGLSANGHTWEIGNEKGPISPVPLTYLIGYPAPPDSKAGER